MSTNIRSSMDYVVKLYKDWRLHSQFHEIVSDMEDESFFAAEKQSIRDSGRSLKKYGSTCNHVRNSSISGSCAGGDLLLRHELSKTDTLQGIALKYGCTTEQIRRANRLFAQDSLFLRQHLMIPIAKDSSFAAELLAAEEAGAARPQTLALADGSDAVDGCAAGGATAAAAVALSPEEENRKDIDAFLGKIDSTLAQTRRYVAKSQNSFDYDATTADGAYGSNAELGHGPSNGDGGGHVRRYHNMSSSSSYQQYQQAPYDQQHQHYRHSSTGGSGTNNYYGYNNNNNNSRDSIELVTISTNSRRVQNSLQRLEQQQDDFFKL